jgi:hypothetical protein
VLVFIGLLVLRVSVSFSLLNGTVSAAQTLEVAVECFRTLSRSVARYFVGLLNDSDMFVAPAHSLVSCLRSLALAFAVKDASFFLHFALLINLLG